MAIGRTDRPFGGARLILTVEWSEAVALAVPQRSASSGWQRKCKDEAECALSAKPRSTNSDMAACRCRLCLSAGQSNGLRHNGP